MAVIGAEDNRQITACLASSLYGDLLPLQLIFTGTTTRCHPAATAASNAASIHITHSANHWSSLETMQDWVKQVLLPYAESCISTFKLRSDSHIVLMLDVWSVHKGEPFRRFLRTHHPRVHLVYIPANCTSKLQVADVTLQRPFKSSIRRNFDLWAANMLRQQMAAGAVVGLKEHFGMPVLKPLLLQWCVESWKELQQRKDIIAERGGTSAWYLSTTYTTPTSAWRPCARYPSRRWILFLSLKEKNLLRTRRSRTRMKKSLAARTRSATCSISLCQLHKAHDAAHAHATALQLQPVATSSTVSRSR